MPRKKIELIGAMTTKQREAHINKLVVRVNAIGKDMLTIAKKQNVMIEKYNGMAEQVNVCKELLQKFINAIPRKGDKPKDIIVP